MLIYVFDTSYILFLTFCLYKFLDFYFSRHELLSNTRFSFLSKDRQTYYSNFVKPNNKYLQDILLIYTICHKSLISADFPIWKTSIPSIGIKCNETTNRFDCNEAGLYLDFIINHYDTSLAKTYIFAHGHENSWHYPTSLFQAIFKLVETKYFKKQKFGGIFNTMYAEGPYPHTEYHWAPKLYQYVFNGTSMPENMIDKKNQRPCCSTFFVRSEEIHKRRKEEYIHIRNQLTSWSHLNSETSPNPAYYCGRIMEYTWHILFTNKSYVPKCRKCCGSFFFI